MDGIMRSKFIIPGHVYAGSSGIHKKVLRKMASGSIIEYQIVRKTGRGRGKLGNIYMCDKQTFCTWAKDVVK